MEKKLFVSFIVAVYNRVRFLEDCLSSILQIKSVMYEIILIDDASTDGSSDICEAYARKYDFIQLIKFQKNSGVGVAKQAGLERSRGMYLYFLDSDDYLDRDGISNTLNILQKFPETELCWVNYYEQPADSQTKTKLGEITHYQILEIDDFLSNMSNISGSMWRFFFRRDFIHKWGLSIPPVRYWEDFIFVILCLLKSQKILLCPFYCCVYRRFAAENSIMKSMQFSMERKGFYFVLDYIAKFLEKNCISESRVYHIEYLVLCMTFPTLLYDPFEQEESGKGREITNGLFIYYRKNGGDKTLRILRQYARRAFLNMTRGRKTVICPAGHASVKLDSFVLEHEEQIIAFLDNYKKRVSIKKKGKELPVYSFGEFRGFQDVCIFIYSAHEKELIAQLNKEVYIQSAIFSSYDLLRYIQQQMHENISEEKLL